VKKSDDGDLPHLLRPGARRDCDPGPCQQSNQFTAVHPQPRRPTVATTDTRNHVHMLFIGHGGGSHQPTTDREIDGLSQSPHGRVERMISAPKMPLGIDAHRDRRSCSGLRWRWTEDNIRKYPAMNRAGDVRAIVRFASGFTCSYCTPSAALRLMALYSPLTWSVLLCAGPIFFFAARHMNRPTVSVAAPHDRRTSQRFFLRKNALTTWRTEPRKAKASANKPGHCVGASRKIRSLERAAGI
jgi:hypothetical protein